MTIVRSCGCEEEDWKAKDVERKFAEAMNQFMEFWEQMMGSGECSEESEEEGGPSDEVKGLKKWVMPRVEVLDLEELVVRCWV